MITINYTTMNHVHVVVLAGGLGKRMESSLPKVLHVVQGKPMCVHVLEKVKKLHPKGIYVVVGKYRSMIEETIQQYMSVEDIVFVNQDTPKGTGHALMCAKDEIMKLYQKCVAHASKQGIGVSKPNANKKRRAK